MKKYKKNILFLLCVSSLFSLTACTDTKEQTPNEYINKTVDPALQDMSE